MNRALRSADRHPLAWKSPHRCYQIEGRGGISAVCFEAAKKKSDLKEEKVPARGNKRGHPWTSRKRERQKEIKVSRKGREGKRKWACVL